jgi:hypothetical protein
VAGIAAAYQLKWQLGGLKRGADRQFSLRGVALLGVGIKDYIEHSTSFVES